MDNINLHNHIFLLFAGDHYYPQKAWKNFQGAFPTLDEAKDFLIETSLYKQDWWHIVDIISLQIVEES